MQGVLLQIRYLETGLSKSFEKINFFSFGQYVIRVLLVCTRMSLACHSYVFVYHLYVTRMYWYVIRMSLVCHPYVTRMYLYVIRISLVCTRMSSVCHS